MGISFVSPNSKDRRQALLTPRPPTRPFSRDFLVPETDEADRGRLSSSAVEPDYQARDQSASQLQFTKIVIYTINFGVNFVSSSGQRRLQHYVLMQLFL
jgi:hypothetical protein